MISGAIDNASYAGDNDKASYDGDNNDKAYKIVHLGEVFRSREFKCAGKLHNLPNVDTSILTWNRFILSCQVLAWNCKTLIIWSCFILTWNRFISTGRVLSKSGKTFTIWSNIIQRFQRLVSSETRIVFMWSEVDILESFITKKNNTIIFFVFAVILLFYGIYSSKQSYSLECVSPVRVIALEGSHYYN